MSDICVTYVHTSAFEEFNFSSPPTATAAKYPAHQYYHHHYLPFPFPSSDPREQWFTAPRPELTLCSDPLLAPDRESAMFRGGVSACFRLDAVQQGGLDPHPGAWSWDGSLRRIEGTFDWVWVWSGHSRLRSGLDYQFGAVKTVDLVI